MDKTKHDLNLLDSLIANQAIQLDVNATSWQDAIVKSVAPLVASKAVAPRYAQAIIASTIKYGPYYIISNEVAMPHARPKDGVNKSAFSLLILARPIRFANDERKIKILITLAAASNAMHVSVALPQVVASFESEAVIAQLLQAQTSEQVIAILKKIDYTKYLNS